MNSITQSGYLTNLLNEIPAENYLMRHVFERMDEARQGAVNAARRGDIRKFRHAFMSVGKEVACRQHDVVPYRGCNRITISEKNYDRYARLFGKVSQEDAAQFYGVTPEEYTEWMAEWTTFYFYTGRGPIFSTTLLSMDFPDEKTAKQQTGEYPEAEYNGNSDLWNEKFKSLYDSIDDEPNLCYRIKFIGSEHPGELLRPSFLDECF